MKALLFALGILLSGCNDVRGKTVFVLTAEQVLGYYQAGVLDTCMESSREDMKQAGIPLTVLNLQATYGHCQNESHRLLRERGTDIVPETMPGIRPNRNGNL